ncbi:PfkB family carbohydrate kinase, partial [Staphylococcus epidermidis]
ACTVQKLGGHAEMITQLGNDAFGDIILETIDDIGVGTQYIERTNEANTALAFVSLKEDGQRDFSFYRKPSADMLYDA